MTAFAFLSRLSPLLRGRFGCKVRAISCTVTCSQLHKVEGPGGLTGKVDRFGGVTVNLAEVGLPVDISEDAFSRLLKGLLSWSHKINSNIIEMAHLGMS